MWNVSDNVYEVLGYFTWDAPPYKSDTRDSRRMFLDEMKEEETRDIINWFEDNKMLVLTDILRGRGEFAAEWVLVAQKN